MGRFGWKTKSDPLITLWGQVIHARDEECQRCWRRAPYKLDAAHVLSRGSAPKLKYEPLNGILLCVIHHRWADGEGTEFRNWVNEKWPGRVDQLRLWARTRGKIDKAMVKVQLRLELQNLQRERVTV